MIIGHGVGAPTMSLQQRKNSTATTESTRAAKFGTNLGSPVGLSPLGGQLGRARTR